MFRDETEASAKSQATVFQSFHDSIAILRKLTIADYLQDYHREPGDKIIDHHPLKNLSGIQYF